VRLAILYHQLIHAGGLENYLIEFSQRMTAAGHELVYVTSQTTPEVAEKLGGRMVLVGRPAGKSAFGLWRFSKQGSRVARQQGADAVLGFGRTVVQDVHRAGGGCHAMYSQLMPFWKRFRIKNLLELHLEKRLYSAGLTGHYVTNSNRVTAQLQGCYLTPWERFTTIHTAVDTELYRPAQNRAAHRDWMCRRLQTDPSQPIFLFVSLSHRRKGLDALLAALARTPGATLWIVGKPMNRTYWTKAQGLGVENRIRTLPVTLKLVEIYQAADWFVHPTLYDACANTVLQSMACGLPGIISSQDGAVDHIHDGRNGLMLHRPQEVESVATAMGRALAIPEEDRIRMGDEAAADMRSLTWDRHVREWEQLLESRIKEKV